MRSVDFLRSLRSTTILDRTLPSEQLLTELAKSVGSQPLRLICDAISEADTQSLAYPALGSGGLLIIVHPESIPFELNKPEDGKRVVHVLGSVQYPPCKPCGEEIYKRLNEWLE